MKAKNSIIRVMLDGRENYVLNQIFTISKNKYKTLISVNS